jgi:hypothetical protein
MFCRSLFVLFYFFFWPLCCLFFLDIRIMIAPFVSSSSSFNTLPVVWVCRPGDNLLFPLHYIYLGCSSGCIHRHPIFSKTLKLCYYIYIIKYNIRYNNKCYILHLILDQKIFSPKFHIVAVIVITNCVNSNHHKQASTTIFKFYKL